MDRVSGLRSALIGAAAVLAAPLAAAQSSLDGLVIVAPAAPGGGWDQTARALQYVLEAEGLVRVVEVQNVPGAAGTVGLSQFINAERGRGGALLVSGLVMLGATLWNDAPASIGEVTPIARLTGEYEVVAVPASSPHHDLKGLMDAFRQRPAAFAWGGGSAGGTDHILAGLLAEAAGVDPRTVNYVAFSGGGEAVAALLGGHVAAGISGYSEFAAHIASGRLRAVGISSPARVSGLEVPTLRDAGLNVDLANWRAVLAPAGISAADRSRLTNLVGRAVRSSRWQAILHDREWTDLYLDGAAFEAFLRTEHSRFARVVARLRGPATGTPVATGQRIVPAAVLGGCLLVAFAWTARYVRARSIGRHDSGAPQPVRREEHGAPVNRRAMVLVSSGLAAFALLLRPLGFVPAAASLFALTALAFTIVETPPPPGRMRPRVMVLTRGLVIGAVFCTLIYLAFTRGLGLALPAGSVWTWMR